MVRGRRRPARQFVPFGHSLDGGLVAFWRYDGRPVHSAPIVYLDSEGDTCDVVARTVDEFASLLATGDELYYLLRGRRDPHWVSPGEAGADMSALGIAEAPHPVETVRAARAENPDLDAFVRRWVDASSLDSGRGTIRRDDAG